MVVNNKSKNRPNNGRAIKILTTMAYDETKYVAYKTISVFHVISLSFMRSFIQGITSFFGEDDLRSTAVKFESARKNAEIKLRTLGGEEGGAMIVGTQVNISEMGDKSSVLVCHMYGTLLRRL